MQRVMDVLSSKENHARTLLIHYRWDVDNLLAVLVDKGKDRLYAEAGVTLVEHNSNVSQQLPSEVMCGICMDEIPADQVTLMDCGHCFCNECKYSPLHLLYFFHAMYAFCDYSFLLMESVLSTIVLRLDRAFYCENK